MRVLLLSEGTIGFRLRDPLALRERTQRCMRARSTPSMHRRCSKSLMVKVWALLSDNETYYKMLTYWYLIVLLFRWFASTGKKLRQPKVSKKAKRVVVEPVDRRVNLCYFCFKRVESILMRSC